MDTITLGNGLIERTLHVDADSRRFSTASLTNKKTGTNWAAGKSEEFRLAIGEDDGGSGAGAGRDLDPGSFVYETHGTRQLPNGRTQLTVQLKCTQSPVRVYLLYELHPDHAWIRKRLKVENVGDRPLLLRRYDTERLTLQGNLTAHFFASWRWGGQWADKGVNVGFGLHSDPITDTLLSPPSVPRESPLLISNARDDEGLWVLAEVPIREVTAVEIDGRVQLASPNPCGTRIMPGETADVGAGVVIGLYQGKHPAGFEHFRRYLQEFIIKEDRAKKAVLVYNTWYSQGFHVSEAACDREVDVAADLGLEMFVLDAGWHSNFGDWEVDKQKFPHGLERLSAHCHKKNMKFGLWMDARLASLDSRVYQTHPEWGHKCANGQTYGQIEGQTFFGHPLVCMCLSSGYGDYLRDKFMQLVSQFELDAVKIDNCGYPEGTEPHQRIANFWDDCYGVGHQHVTPASHNESWKQYALILDSFRSMYPKLLIESIPCGLSQLDKFDVDWISDYFFPFRACGVNPDTDWPTEIHYMRTLNYYMSYTHPISTIHQGWVDPQAFCLELLCASVFGGNLWTGVTGFIEEATPEQKEVVKGWVRWHKENRRYLSVYQHLSPEGAPVIPLRGQQEGVDGFAHLLSDGGWIFLFNPTAEPREVTLELDLARYGIADVADISSGGRWRFDAKNRRLTMSQTVPAMGFTQSRLTARMG